MKTFAITLICLTFWLVGFQIAKDRSTAGGRANDSTGEASGISFPDSSSPQGLRNRPSLSDRTSGSDTGSARWLRWASSLGRTDPSNLPDLLEQVSADSRELNFLFEYWVQTDAPGLFRHWKKQFDLKGYEETYDLGHYLFYRWFQIDPATAAATVEQLAASNGSRYLENNDVLSNLADHDPRKAILISSKLPPTNTDYIGYQWSEFIGNQPESWANFLIAHPSGHLTKNGMEAVGKSWGTTDPESAMNFSRKLHGQNLESFQREVFHSWGKMDFDKAHNWFFQQENARTRDLLRPTFLENWAKHDLDEAFNWTRENMRGQRLNKAFECLASGAAFAGHDARERLWQNLASRNEQMLALKKIEKALSLDPNQPLWSRTISPEEAAWISERKKELKEGLVSGDSKD